MLKGSIKWSPANIAKSRASRDGLFVAKKKQENRQIMCYQGLLKNIIFGGDSQRVRAIYQCSSGAREAVIPLVESKCTILVRVR